MTGVLRGVQCTGVDAAVFTFAPDAPGSQVSVAQPSCTAVAEAPAAGHEDRRDITFRYEVVPSDVKTVAEIVKSTGVFHDAEVDVAIELVQERLAKGDASGYYFVFAEQAGSTLGYTCFGPIPCTIARFDLYWIAVDKRLHSRGIGSLLMAETEQRVLRAGGTRIYIETSSRPDYLPTQRFYERNRYRIEAELEGFYNDGDNKVIYARKITAEP